MVYFDVADKVLTTLYAQQTALEQLIAALDDRLTVVEKLLEFPAPPPPPEPDPVDPPTPPPPAPGKVTGVWLNTDEIMKLPTAGSTWNKLLSDANRQWGSADLGNNSSAHDVKTLSGALVAVRTDSVTMKSKVITALKSAMNSPLNRVLELARGLQSYVIAADLIGYRDSAFMGWVVDVVTDMELSGHPGNGMLETARAGANNWGCMARASLAAAAVYLERDDWLELVTHAHTEFIGDDVAVRNMVFTKGNEWISDPDHPLGVNPRGSVIKGINASGWAPEDARRGSSGLKMVYPPDPNNTYLWEWIAGEVVAALILHRAGKVAFGAGDNAMVRALDALYHRGETASNPAFYHPAAGDDTWIPWVVNHFAKTDYPTEAARPGKGFGVGVDWVYAG